MKRILLITLILVALLGICGCSSNSYVAIGSIDKNTSTKMSMSYKQLSGTKEKKLTVKEGEKVDISVDIVTKKGTIDAHIYKDNDKENYVYEGIDLKTSNFTVTLSEPGDYKIRIKAAKHKGSYSFSW